MNQPLVSVIVPTYNSSEFLEACLESIKNQSFCRDRTLSDSVPCEIIVVDNFSTDNTPQIAKKYADKFYQIGPERSAQVNYGVEQSKGEYVAIIDSDMELSPNVIKECVEKMQNGTLSDSVPFEECVEEMQKENVVGVVIPEESVGEGFWAECKKLERSFYVGVPWMEAARFFHKSDYEKIGGYDEEMVSGEDWDFSQRIEKLGALARTESYIYHNEGRISLPKTVKKKFYYAQKFAKYTAKNKDTSKTATQTSISARYKLFLSQPAKLFKNPIIASGMLFMKTLEFVFGGVGLITGKN